jgi:hypothetical protein
VRDVVYSSVVEGAWNVTPSHTAPPLPFIDKEYIDILGLQEKHSYI